MWRVVERTALAEAEVEYQDDESDTIWVKFPVAAWSARRDGEARLTEGVLDLLQAHVVIWTTTPWTIPGNRAIAYSPRITYGLYEVTAAENDFRPAARRKADLRRCAGRRMLRPRPKLTLNRLRDVSARRAWQPSPCAIRFRVSAAATNSPCRCSPATMSPMMPAPASSTPRPATAARTSTPGWMRRRELEARGIDTAIPFTVDDAGFYTTDAPGFGRIARAVPARVIDDNGKKGNANERVIKALIERNALFARGRLKHSYPHSWRSKKPVIFRNTPQWFVYMDKDLGDGTTLRTPRAEGHRRHPLRARRRPEPPARHDRGAPGLGAVAPARLGRADRRLRR